MIKPSKLIDWILAYCGRCHRVSGPQRHAGTFIFLWTSTALKTIATLLGWASPFWLLSDLFLSGYHHQRSTKISCSINKSHQIRTCSHSGYSLPSQFHQNLLTKHATELKYPTLVKMTAYLRSIAVFFALEVLLTVFLERRTERGISQAGRSP